MITSISWSEILTIAANPSLQRKGIKLVNKGRPPFGPPLSFIVMQTLDRRTI